MVTDEARLMSLAGAVADGTPVDWAQELESTPDPEVRQVVEQLRVLAAMAAVHRSADASTRDSAAEAHPDAVRTSWGPLKLRRKIGKGSFGTVYLAWDPSLEREVALKIFQESQRSEAVIREGRLLASVRHTNIATVYGVDEFDETVGLWMEFVDGLTLKQALRERGVFGAHETALIGIDLCRAVAAVHKAGLLHRDIKAQNVMREAGGRIVLMDFGAGEVRTERAQPFRSLTGTPLYLAPEVLSGQPASVASDIYSVGVLLYHLLTHRYPVEGTTVAELEAAHAQQRATPISDLRPDLAAGIVQVIGRALDRDPARRPRSAGAMQQELLNAITPDLARTRTEPVESGGDAVHQPALAHVAGRAEPWPRRRAIAAGVLLTAVVVTAGALWSTRGPAPPIALSDVKTVAVLPFQGSDTADEKAFGRGLSDLLTARLSEITSLRVVSQTSAQMATAQTMAITEIGRALGADVLVEGSVHIVADRIRVDVRLVRAATDSVAWNRSFEDKMLNILDLESNLALAVGGQLRNALTTGERKRLGSQETTRPQAQQAYLLGWASLETQTLEGTTDAIQKFKEAIAVDPLYARAHAVLSHAYWYLGVGLNAMPVGESERLAKAEARRAFQLDPQLPRAHVALGQVAFYFDWDWEAAEAAFSSAVRLNPSDADAYEKYAWFLAAMGRLDQAVAYMRRARELDPLSQLRRSALAAALYYADLYTEAVRELEALKAASPTYVTARVGLARAYSALGRTDDAIRELETVRTDSAQFLTELGRLYVQAGDLTRARAILREVESKRRTAPQSVRLEGLAYLYGALGSTEVAIDFIEQALSQRSPTLLWLKVDPRYDSLRSNPRFIDVLREMKLTD